MKNQILIGPFSQLLTMRGLPVKGPISDESLEIIRDGGILIQDEKTLELGSFNDLRNSNVKIFEIKKDKVAFPGFIDPHTHICFAGSRANDYAMRIAGKTYLEIAKEGGGIWQTVQNTRSSSLDELTTLTQNRAQRFLQSGITTAEVKSGYGLDLENEIKMLNAIKEANQKSKIDLISTCLSAHITPRDFSATSVDYLDLILNEILPIVKENGLTNRVDIFIEDGAFSVIESLEYLKKAQILGFDLTIHGDQFHPGGSKVAIEVGAVSVDHLESSTDNEIKALANSDVVSTVLPGASLGLGMQYAPARKLLDAGCCLAIGSDWNPGSAPMGNLLAQAALMSASEKLTTAETFAGITFRAAKALNLRDRGVLDTGLIADIVCFPGNDYQEILYNQGSLQPDLVIKKGELIDV